MDINKSHYNQYKYINSTMVCIIDHVNRIHFLLSQVLIELPYVFVQAASYGIIVYAMIGFEWTLAKFLWYIFFMYCTLCYFTFYGMMAVAITPNHHVASIVAAAFYAIWNLFSGFIVPRPVSATDL